MFYVLHETAYGSNVSMDLLTLGSIITTSLAIERYLQIVKRQQQTVN